MRISDRTFDQPIASRFRGDGFISVINKETSASDQSIIANKLLRDVNFPYADLPRPSYLNKPDTHYNQIE